MKKSLLIAATLAVLAMSASVLAATSAGPPVEAKHVITSSGAQGSVVYTLANQDKAVEGRAFTILAPGGGSGNVIANGGGSGCIKAEGWDGITKLKTVSIPDGDGITSDMKTFHKSGSPPWGMGTFLI